MPDDKYLVIWLPVVRAAVRELTEKAKELGLLDDLKQTFVELKQRLEREPLEVGELYRTAGPVVELVAAHNLVGINFGVDTARRFVVVRKCWATTKSGL